MKHSPLAFLPRPWDLRREDLLQRPPRAPWGGTRLNDYLGLAGASLAASGPSGAGASRLVSGECAEHQALERDLAAWLQTESALLFSSGYAANVGTIAALAGAGDRIVSDALNHASIIDGARLSRAEIIVVPHLQAEAVARALAAPGARRSWVVTESYFGMDADAPDLATLRRICDDAGAALIVDRRTPSGSSGPTGGSLRGGGHRPDVLVGTLEPSAMLAPSWRGTHSSSGFGTGPVVRVLDGVSRRHERAGRLARPRRTPGGGNVLSPPRRSARPSRRRGSRCRLRVRPAPHRRGRGPGLAWSRALHERGHVQAIRPPRSAGDSPAPTDRHGPLRRRVARPPDDRSPRRVSRRRVGVFHVKHSPVDTSIPLRTESA